MKQILIRTTDTCPTCKGEKEISNPLWKEFGEQRETFERRNKILFLAANGGALAEQLWREELNRWESDFWVSNGYTETQDGYPVTPWDVKRCEDCEGTGIDIQEKHVTLEELSELLEIPRSGCLCGPYL